MNFLYYTSLTLLLFVAVILILLILIQKGRGGGLSSAFGGSGGSTAFGAKTGDVLTWATSIVFGVFILLAVTLDLVVNAQYAKPASATVAPTPVESSAPVTPTTPPLMGSDRIAQELANLQHSASPTTLPTTLPAGLPTTVPSVSVEPSAMNMPAMATPALAIPTTLPTTGPAAMVAPLNPASPATTQPH